MTRRTYLVRRVVALAVLASLVGGFYTMVKALFGGDPRPTVAAPASTVHVVVDASAPGSTAPATTIPVTTIPVTTTTEPPVKDKTVPSAADPAEVLIIGDSDAGSFGPYLKQVLDPTGIVTTELDYKVSSGLSRPDFFDWTTHMHVAVQKVNPDIVVVTFGGNDAQGLRNADKSWAVGYAPGGGGDDAEWRAEYGRRVGEVMDYLGGANRTLVWVGIPNDDNPDVTARLKVQDEVVRAEVAKRPGVVFVDTWNRFGGINGGWAEYVVDPRDGVGKDVRSDDGFHLNVNGAEILALDIAEAVKNELRARGASI